MKLFFLILLTILAGGNVSATTYYLSSQKGNDAADGKSKSSPWRNLEKIPNISSIAAGDSILLERGSVFHGQVIIPYSNIYVGAYGSGALPMISGSVRITRWVAAGKNVWKAGCPECYSGPGDLFVDGKFQPLGRYPNQGYLSISSSSKSKQAFSDTSLQFPDGHWNDAEIVVRSSRWTLDNLPAQEFQNKTFRVSKSASYELQQGSGYFIQKHISTLDKSGEWFFNASSHEIFLYLDPGINPNDHKIEVSINELGLSFKNLHHVTLEDLILKHHRVGIHMEDCQTIVLQRLVISDSGKNGLEIISCQGTQIKNSIVTNSNNNGVSWRNSEVTFTDNSILRTGLHAGRGAGGNGTYVALSISSDGSYNKNTLVENNKIDSTGYIAVDFRSGNTSIKNNIISNFCMIKDDGAGIYTWHNTRKGNTIEANTISNGPGAPKGAANSTELFASGIYIDDQSADIIIKNNSISFCATAGIFLHNAKNITLTGNTVFSNGYSISNKEKGQLYIKLDTLGEMRGNTALDLELSQNKWIASQDASYCIFLSARKKQDLQKLGSSDQNQFSASQPAHAVAELYAEAGLCSAPQEFSLADWSQKSGLETRSVFSTPQVTQNFPPVGRNLVNNGDMALGRNGWIVWPDKSTLSVENKIENAPSLKINVPADNMEALLYHAGFPLNKNKLYRLTFTIASPASGKIEFVPLMAASPWKALGAYACFSVDSSSKTFTYYFKPDQNCADARVNFKSNSTFWITHVSLYEVADRANIIRAGL